MSCYPPGGAAVGAPSASAGLALSRGTGVQHSCLGRSPHWPVLTCPRLAGFPCPRSPHLGWRRPQWQKTRRSTPAGAFGLRRGRRAESAQMIRCSRRRGISASRPRSRSTSSVWAPSSGAGRRARHGVAESFTGKPVILTGPRLWRRAPGGSRGGSVRVWQITSRWRGSRTGRPPPQMSHHVYEHVKLSQVGKQLAQRLESGDLGVKLVPNVASPPHAMRTCRHAEGLSACSVGFA